MEKQKIGLFGASMLEWGGGIDLLKNIIHGLNHTDRYELFLFVPVPGDDLTSIAKRTVKKLLKKSVFKGIDPQVVESLVKEYPNVQVVYFSNSPQKLKEKVKETGISILFPCAYSLGRDFPVPWVGYIPDFQHKYLPELFTEEECVRRDQTIGERIKDADSLLVTSETAKNDVRKFYPDQNKEIHAIPFSPSARVQWLEQNENVLGKYGLDPDMKYFLISNQFWIHKDHACAFKALAELHRQSGYEDIHLICTGAETDYRNAEYMKQLHDLIHGLGMEEMIHFLGYIPKIDQIMIMKHAVAVVQPTKYEGSPGGGEVEDAVAVGMQAIVSDIPVNLEIEDDSVLFFHTGDEKDLSGKMQEAIDRNWTIPKRTELERQGDVRQNHYYEILKTMIDHTVR